MSGLRVTGTIIPSSPSDTYATHSAIYGKGGHRTVANNTVRDAISAARREEGMTVYSIASALKYRLLSDLTTWTLDGGSITAADVAFTNITATVNTFPVVGANVQAAIAYLADSILLDTIFTPLNTGLGLTNTDVATIAGASGVAHKLNYTEKAASNGVCELVSGLVPLARLGNVASNIVFKGAIIGATGVTVAGAVTVADGTGTNGWMYKAASAGSHNYGSGSITLAIGDWLIYNGTVWQKIPNADLVSSVFGRIGPIDATLGDYTASLITCTTNALFAGTNVQTALNGIQTALTTSNTNITTNSTAIASIKTMLVNITGQAAWDTAASETILSLRASIDNLIINNSGYVPTQRSVGISSTLNTTDELVVTTVSGINLVLPSTIAYPNGRRLLIKDESYSAGDTPITFTTQGGNTLKNGNVIQSSGDLIQTDGGFVELYSKGGNIWYILNSN